MKTALALLAVLVLYLSLPVPRSILLGACVGVIGLLIRAYAAGYHPPFQVGRPNRVVYTLQSFRV